MKFVSLVALVLVVVAVAEDAPKKEAVDPSIRHLDEGMDEDPLTEDTHYDPVKHAKEEMTRMDANKVCMPARTQNNG